jgi:hypothetical protein
MKTLAELKERDSKLANDPSQEEIKQAMDDAREMFGSFRNSSDVKKLICLIGAFRAVALALIGASNNRRRELELRVQELEAGQSQIKYCGTHEPGREYQPGNFCTHQGSLWHCNERTVSPPGDGDRWTLAVKKGRDARL